MLENIILGVIFALAIGYFIYKIFFTKNSCGCNKCDCDKK